MKRTFPLIIALITISLLGIIFIQVSWIQSMIKVREDQFEERVKLAMSKAAQKMLNSRVEVNAQQLLRDYPTNPFLIDGMQQKNFLSSFTNSQMRELIAKSFKETDLNVPEFEYSVSCNIEDEHTGFFKPELHSPGFLKLYNNKLHVYDHPIIPESGSPLENLVAEGSIWIIIPNSKATVIKELGWMLAGALLFTIIIISAFYLTVRAMLKQKKISEIKSDFINNMTHEFKTPIATISLAVDALKNEKVVGDREKSNYFTGIIKDENRRMNKQVETILQAALLEKQELQLNLKALHVNDLVQNGFEHFKIMLEENNGTADLQLNAKNDIITADEVHITNLIRNLMDNAIKYAKPDTPLHIRISTSNTKKSLLLYIEDNGVGMSKETVNRIFEKFFRAHTGNVHNVKGFGLGLTYVKAVIDAHKGRIKVESTLGKGSIFTVELPLKAVEEPQAI
jgi:two-component system, OmpR family, phosphate regulon sensor histidine kinase PhoR